MYEFDVSVNIYVIYVGMLYLACIHEYIYIYNAVYTKFVSPVGQHIVVSDITLYQWARLADNGCAELLLATIVAIICYYY